MPNADDYRQTAEAIQGIKRDARSLIRTCEQHGPSELAPRLLIVALTLDDYASWCLAKRLE